jgi:hypothetical protein
MASPCDNGCERTTLPRWTNGHTRECNFEFIDGVAAKVREIQNETSEESK